MAEPKPTPRGTGDGGFKTSTRSLDGVRERRRDVDTERSAEEAFKIEQVEARKARLNLMEACVAWEGVRSLLSDLSIDPVTAKVRTISDNVAQLRAFLEDMQMFNNVGEITEAVQMAAEREKQELRSSTIAFKFDLGGFIDYIDQTIALNPRAKNFQKHEALTHKDYVDLNQDLNILKRFANRRELIIDISSKILRADTTPAARLTTKTEPAPDTADPATAAAGESKAVVGPTISTVSTTSTGPTPTVATPDITVVAGEPGPATATTPDSSTAAPDPVASGDSNSGDTTNPADEPDSTQTSTEADPGAVFENYGLWSEKDDKIITSDILASKLEEMDRDGKLFTAENIQKCLTDPEGRELLPDRATANRLLNLLLQAGIVD